MTFDMNISHDWDLTPKQAIALQKELAAKVEQRDRLPPGGRRALKHIAGLDVAFEDGGKVTRGAVVVLRMADLETVAEAVARRPTSLPYIPGLLSFREVPVLLDALALLDIPPDILICDGHGLAHPRRFGIACHLGLLTGLPAIGVAKSRLTGRHDEPGSEKGYWAALVDTPKGGGRGGAHRHRPPYPGGRKAGLCLHRPPRQSENIPGADAPLHRSIPPARTGAPGGQAVEGGLDPSEMYMAFRQARLRARVNTR